MTEAQVREQIVHSGRRLYERGFVAATDGNISVRFAPGSILMTPTCVSKGALREDDLLVVDEQGQRLSGGRHVSSELTMHLLIYRLRPEVNAVVHAHPPTATGFAAAGIALEEPILAEAVVVLGRVPLARYATPGTAELAASLAPLVPQHVAILMANHGVVTYAASLENRLSPDGNRRAVRARYPGGAAAGTDAASPRGRGGASAPRRRRACQGWRRALTGNRRFL